MIFLLPFLFLTGFIVFFFWIRPGYYTSSVLSGEQNKAPQKDAARFEVVLKSVHPEKEFVLVETSEGEKKIYYDENTYFFKDGKEALPEELKAGEYIGILITSENRADYVIQGVQKCTGERTVSPLDLPMKCEGKPVRSKK